MLEKHYKVLINVDKFMKKILRNLKKSEKKFYE